MSFVTERWLGGAARRGAARREAKSWGSRGGRQVLHSGRPRRACKLPPGMWRLLCHRRGHKRVLSAKQGAGGAGSGGARQFSLPSRLPQGASRKGVSRSPPCALPEPCHNARAGCVLCGRMTGYAPRLGPRWPLRGAIAHESTTLSSPGARAFFWSRVPDSRPSRSCCAHACDHVARRPR